MVAAIEQQPFQILLFEQAQLVLYQGGVRQAVDLGALFASLVELLATRQEWKSLQINNPKSALRQIAGLVLVALLAVSLFLIF